MPIAERSVPSTRHLRRLSCSSLLLGLLAASSGCGSGSTETGILINLANLPTRTSRIAVSSKLDGKAGTMDMVDFAASGLTRFGVTVPATATGALNIDLTVYDADRCIQGTAAVMASLPAARGTQVTASVSAKSPRQCEPLLPCADRTLCTQTKAQTNRLWSVWALSNTDVWAVGDSSTVLHWDGKTWTLNNNGIPAGISLSSVWASAPDDVWAVGGTTLSSGNIFHFDGASWTQHPTTTRYLNWIYGTSKNDIFIVGVSNAAATVPGEFRRYNATTNGWDFINAGVNRDYFAVWASSPTDVWISGGSGTLMHFTGTPPATAIPLGATNDLRDIHGYVTQSGQTIVYAVGLGGLVARYDGTPSPRLTTIGALTLNGVIATPEFVYVTTTGGSIYKSEGVTDIFTSFSSGTDILYGINLAPNGIGWVVGSGGFQGYIDTRP